MSLVCCMSRCMLRLQIEEVCCPMSDNLVRARISGRMLLKAFKHRARLTHGVLKFVDRGGRHTAPHGTIPVLGHSSADCKTAALRTGMKHGALKSQIEEAYCTTLDDFVRVQIIDGKGYIVGETKSWITRNWNMKLQLKEVKYWTSRLAIGSSFETYCCGACETQLLLRKRWMRGGVARMRLRKTYVCRYSDEWCK